MKQAESGALRKRGLTIAKALNALAPPIGRTFTMRTEEGRFRIQKAVYLLRYLRYAPAQGFVYNLYQMGPYSPDLTKCYFDLEDDGIRGAGVAKDIPGSTFALVTEAMRHDKSFLEALTTLLDVYSQTASLPVSLGQAKAIKPHLDEALWKEVRAFLQLHRPLIDRT